MNKDERKFKVMFGENKIIGGVQYGKGVYNLKPELARACVAGGGVMAPAEKKELDNHFSQSAVEGAPLSLEETMERFGKFDFSDDVMRSMQYYQAEIQERNSPAQTYGDVANSAETSFNASQTGTEGGNAGETGKEGGTGGKASETGKDKGTGTLSGAATDTSDLPADFPAREELIAGGVTTLEQLRGMKRADILELEKIGDAKANQIGARLAGMEENK